MFTIAALLPRKLLSHFLNFYLENFILCLLERLSFHFILGPYPNPDPDPKFIPDPVPVPFKISGTGSRPRIVLDPQPCPILFYFLG